ncbi:CHC2 zinc finger domain-containing protein [Bacillus coreaensis]
MTVIDLIKENLSIIEVLERYTSSNISHANLKRKHFNIRCPFHNDRNPSFTVYKNTNTFRCWSGCNDGKPGDVINFVMLLRNVNTKEAINILKYDFGLSFPESRSSKEWQKKRASREREAALKKETNKKIIEAINALKEVDQSARAILGTIRKLEDLDRIGNLYHVLSQIDYWIDSLVDNQGIESRIHTLKEVSQFLKIMKEGEGA